MSVKDAIKVFSSNIVCIVSILLGIAGCTRFVKNSFLLSLCIVIIIVSIIVDIYINMKIFSKKSSVTDELSYKEMQALICRYSDSGAQETRNAAQNMLRQLETFEKRKAVLTNLLNTYFGEDDNLYTYTALIENAQENIQCNIKLALKRISIFDANEYQMLKNHQGNYSQAIWTSKMEQYRNHLEYINKLIDENDRFIIEFDNLITEVTRINESDGENDLSILKDTVDAMKKLHFSDGGQMSELMDKY